MGPTARTATGQWAPRPGWELVATLDDEPGTWVAGAWMSEDEPGVEPIPFELEAGALRLSGPRALVLAFARCPWRESLRIEADLTLHAGVSVGFYFDTPRRPSGYVNQPFFGTLLKFGGVTTDHGQLRPNAGEERLRFVAPPFVAGARTRLAMELDDGFVTAFRDGKQVVRLPRPETEHGAGPYFGLNAWDADLTVHRIGVWRRIGSATAAIPLERPAPERPRRPAAIPGGVY